ncbi:MAG: translation initiation factor IF-2 [Bacillota bacterium]
MARNIRVYELARELDVQSKEVLKLLQEELGLDVNNHMATVNQQVAEKIRSLISGDTEDLPDTVVESSEDESPVEPKETATVQDTGAEVPAEEEDEDEDDTTAEETLRRSKKPSGTEVAAEKRSRGRRERKNRAVTAGVDEVVLSGSLSVAELAEKLDVSVLELMQHLVGMGIMANINQELDLESQALIARELGADFEVQSEEEAEDERHPHRRILAEKIQEDDPDNSVPRAPVVTVMGHVDHGKTTLLDTIRKTHVIDEESGGITQHIGASTVEYEGKRIVFLDTPGHEAFTTMRARGARATDIVVLVVAADDGVMPQTEEAINHAKAAYVPIVVAVNKIDLPGAQPDRIRQELTAHELIPEEWGGDTVFVDISALEAENVEELLEMLTLVAEMEELRADPDKRAHGLVIESRVDKGRGPVATVLIQGGTLRKGDAFVAGIYAGRVRAMFDDRGDAVEEAGPSTPVEVLGLGGLPDAGDFFVVVEDDSEAKDIASELQNMQRETEIQATPKSLEDFYRDEDEFRELRIILKADVHGSLDAASAALTKLSGDEVSVSVIHGGVGAINESDIMLASASDAVVLGFNVRPTGGAQRAAEKIGVDIRTYRVIYEMLDDVKRAARGLLAPEIREVVLGRAEVREVFRVPGAGNVAGLYVTDGVMRRNAQVRLLREGRVIHDGRVASLKRFKDDAREVAAGYECGLSIEGYNDIHVGDEIEAYTHEEIPRD